MFTLQIAKKLQLTGWVHNQATGSVEIHACGSEQALRELEVKIASGPDGSKVDRLIQEICDDPNLNDFIIKK